MHSTNEDFSTLKRSHFLEIFSVFLRLGLLSFGGPIAHLGYFHEAFVKRRRWISEAGFTDVVALSQVLPGPSSSQVGFALGVIRGSGLVGGLAAWLGFTLPTVVILLAFAYGAASFTAPWQVGLIHGFKLVAVAVVAHAVWGMARNLAGNWRLMAIAAAALGLALFFDGNWIQIGIIALGALAGLAIPRGDERLPQALESVPITRKAGGHALVIFAGLAFALPLVEAATGWQALRLFDGFFRSGALVFGGGHVVLPLLHEVVVTTGWVKADDFVAGYGVTQAMPGPIFSFAAFLGAIAGPAPNGVAGGLLAVVAIFLPGLLLVYGFLPFWAGLRQSGPVAAALRGVNASVVGLLAAAFYQPLWTTTITGAADILLALAGFLLLVWWKLPPWLVLIGLGGAGILMAVL